MHSDGQPPGPRIAWIDHAKGVCIILVVMMHSTLGVEAALGAQGMLNHVVSFVAPFRIPAFFLMSGLLLSRSIDQSWRVYLDRKAAHFAYFYFLWLAISCVLKFGASGVSAVGGQFVLGLIEPFGTLWFIYVLPLFFVVTKIGRSHPLLLAAIALAMNLAAPRTGWTVTDEFASRYVFFLAGYLGVNHAVAIAGWVARHPRQAAMALAFDAVIAISAHALGDGLVPPTPFAALALGMAGSLAVIAVSALLAENKMLPFVRACGANSLAIYLAFFAPMAFTRALIVNFAPGVGATIGSFLVTCAALIGPFLILRLTRNTPLNFLFDRPAKFRLTERPEIRPR